MLNTIFHTKSLFHSAEYQPTGDIFPSAGRFASERSRAMSVSASPRGPGAQAGADPRAINHSRSIFVLGHGRDSRCCDLSAGCDRAFSASYQRHKDAIERQSTRQWDKQERLRKWKYRRTPQVLSLRKAERDKGVLEEVARQRSCAHLESRPATGLTAHLPKEDRAVFPLLTNRVFYWGS
jgi:hypothetical protein